MSVLSSTDAILSSAADNGEWVRSFQMNAGASVTTAATTSCGGITARRCPTPLTLPSVGGSAIGIAFPFIKFNSHQLGMTGELIAALEYSLGTLTVSGNSFAAGVAMPTKTVKGVSGVTASEMAWLVATANLTATTPVVTITYTDQDGNTGNTATLTLPTNVLANSAFLINPHLASGDTGIRAITNISISTGSAGTLVVYGLLVMQVCSVIVSTVNSMPDVYTYSIIPWIATGGETMNFYAAGQTSNSICDFSVQLGAVAELP